MQGSATQEVLGATGAIGAAPAGRIPIARDANAYGESRTRDLYYACLDQRKLFARHRIRIHFRKPADHGNHCTVFDLGYGAIEVKWSDTFGYYRYFYAYEYSNSGTRKFEKVLLREQLGQTAEDAKNNLLSRLADGTFTNGYRAARSDAPRRPSQPVLLAAAAGIALLLGAVGGAFLYFMQ